MVAITGQVPTPGHRHRRVPGNADGRGLPRRSPSTTTWCQNAKDIARVVAEAFHIASTGRPGPVLIDMPKDIQNTIVRRPRLRRADGSARLPAASRSPKRPEQIREALAAISSRRKPIIYCGGGVDRLERAPRTSASSPTRPASRSR